MEDFFHWLGEQTGTVLRALVELLVSAFYGIGDFFAGLGTSLGMNITLINLLFLILGVYLLYSGFRQLLRRALLGGIVRLALAVLLLTWLIN
ncbi:MAG TPA: hypothetical protein VK110_03995 [Salinisphaeraceae bacterium]|nr:hypothetical protein [Salinisphaeraceae bacterium]